MPYKYNAITKQLDYYEPSTVSSLSIDDTQFEVYDDGDNTKKVAFQLSGITPSTTRVLTIPDASGTIALTSGVTLQNAYLGGQTITTTAAGVLSFVTAASAITFTVGGPPVSFTSGVGNGVQIIYNGPAERVSLTGDCKKLYYVATLAQTTSTGGAAIVLNANAGGIQLIGNNAASDAIDIDSIGGLDIDVVGCNITSTTSLDLNSLNTSLALGFNIDSLSAASGVVDSFNPSKDGSVMWVFNVTRTDSAGNMTEYTVNAIWDDSAGTASYRSLKSVDIGSTAGITFNVDMSEATGLVRLNYAITAGTWAISGTRLINYVA